jgi:cardiolipin synthase
MSLNHPHLRWHDGNAVVLLENGQELFPALCEAFDAAQKSIHLETYIFRLDVAGLEILDHLKRAAERGVKVRVVLDGYGSAQDDRTIQSLCVRSVRSAEFTDPSLNISVFDPLIFYVCAACIARRLL